jgi:hypothetical protein
MKITYDRLYDEKSRANSRAVAVGHNGLHAAVGQSRHNGSRAVGMDLNVQLKEPFYGLAQPVGHNQWLSRGVAPVGSGLSPSASVGMLRNGVREQNFTACYEFGSGEVNFSMTMWPTSREGEEARVGKANSLPGNLAEEYQMFRGTACESPKSGTKSRSSCD